MRVTESMLLGQLTSNIDTSSSNYQMLQQELATGRKINQPSDDPTGTNQSLSMRAVLVDINQYQTDANSALSFMQYTDSQLNSAENLVQQARTIAVAAANGGTEDSTSQAAYTAQIQSIIDQLTTVGNSDFNNRKVFAGQMTQTDPYTAGDVTHAYAGDDGALTATIGKGNSVQINVPGDQVFAPQFTALEQLKTDITSGNFTAISDNDLDAIDAGLSTINQTRATFGARIDQVQGTQTLLTTSQQNYQGSLANIEDVDIASAFAQLQVAQNVYQASLVTTSRALQYSLAQYIQ